MLLLTYAFASFVFRVVEGVQAQAVWFHDAPRIAGLLQVDGWVHAPGAGESGYTRYNRRGVRLEPALLARADDGTVWTPLREGRAAWPDQAFGAGADVEVLIRSVTNCGAPAGQAPRSSCLRSMLTATGVR